MEKIRSGEITPENVFLSRRDFLKGMGIISAGAVLLASCGVKDSNSENSINSDAEVTDTRKDEIGDTLTSNEDVINYNNYYEFSTDKEEVAKLAKDYLTSP
jgi:methionine sulfoxide reductase catalytic subunit